METQTAYLFTERQPGITIQALLASDGALDVTVRLKQPAGSLNWRSTLSPDSLSACEAAILKVRGHNKGGGVESRFEISSIEPEQRRAIASWNESEEDSDLDRTRKTLEAKEHLAYYGALTYLALGDRVPEAAGKGEAYKAGISLLGDAYQDPKVNDDSGMKLVLAESVERTDGLEKAAPIYRRVLETRTEIYADRERINALAGSPHGR